METKQKGDIAEQAVALEALKRGWSVLRPIGDRLPYDLVFDVAGTLLRVQVKHAWFNSRSQNYQIDVRRTKTNRRRMIRSRYKKEDVDFVIAYLAEINIFYVFPVDVFLEYAGGIHLVESPKRQRKPKSSAYRDAWQLISQWAAHDESRA